LSKEEREAIEKAGSGYEMDVAVSLEKAVNGTSLMLMLQVGKTHLLFPGDAQWGTWQAALKNKRWNDLLKQTTFYKIGHHGSHNATPKEFVEKTIGKDFWAMASTKTIDQWPNIPKPELMNALSMKTDKIARSDKEGQAPKKTFKVHGKLYIDTSIPV
jgi:beta-lactamase superfamily II metal-dependent hydrolase